MKTPEQTKEHVGRFKPDAWHGYTIAELAMWAHLLRKRATMRAEHEKASKDIAGAENYEAMLRSALG